MTNVRMTVCENYSIFYEVEEEMIVILVIWDNRRNPEDFSLE